MNMTNRISKHFEIRILLIGSIILLLVGIISLDNIGQKDTYEVRVFQCEQQGWGYEIIENSKIIIYQPNIPCIKENKAFPNKNAALNTGKLVLSKIKNKEIPSLTIEELNDILDFYN